MPRSRKGGRMGQQMDDVIESRLQMFTYRLQCHCMFSIFPTPVHQYWTQGCVRLSILNNYLADAPRRRRKRLNVERTPCCLYPSAPAVAPGPTSPFPCQTLAKHHSADRHSGPPANSYSDIYPGSSARLFSFGCSFFGQKTPHRLA